MHFCFVWQAVRTSIATSVANTTRRRRSRAGARRSNALIRNAVITTTSTSADHCFPIHISTRSISSKRKLLSPWLSGSTALTKLVRPSWRNWKAAAHHLVHLWNAIRVTEASVSNATSRGMRTRRVVSTEQMRWISSSPAIRNFEISPRRRNGRIARIVSESSSARPAASTWLVCKQLTLTAFPYCFECNNLLNPSRTKDSWFENDYFDWPYCGN